ncbi:S8 family serine peptidase, partial [Phyllobacterium sp. P30BS-XVII]|uniref:S8 family serine peptidase n=1 Tax=Phyllobacterium sp. P30BS-XVII TaxID=2587046 RepID=UPI0015FCF8DB
SLRGSLPYFRPELEGHWMTTTGFANNQKDQIYNRCGIAKYWCIMAPTIVQTTDTNGGLSNGFNGTSAAAPHASAALALIMQRFPYMTNEQALSVLFTTAQNMVASPDVAPTTGERELTSVVPGTAQVPNAVTGWGLVDLNKAMKGPSQFLGRFNANLSASMDDTWSNDISDVALEQRKGEEQAETAVWKAKKAVRGWLGGLDEGKVQSDVNEQSKDAIKLVSSLAIAIGTGNFAKEQAALAGNDVATSLFQRILNTTRYGRYLVSHASNPQYLWIAKLINEDLMKSLKNPSLISLDSDIAEAKKLLQFEYALMENTRAPYLTKKLADPSAYLGGLTKSGAGSLWLTGKNSYRGDTIVNGGELGIGAEGSIISAAIINNTGLLTVDGKTAAVTANPGGRLKVNA